jgi:autotransporter-associated beta strand protein
MKTRELLILLLIFLLGVEILHADSATWNVNPGDWNWTTATNWTPATVPNGPGDTATFGLSNVTGVIDWGPTQVYGIVFNPGASAFTIAPDELTISGVGITNNSGISQNFVIGYSSPPHYGTLNFIGGAKAGIQTVFTNQYGSTQFFYYSTADGGIFRNHGGLSFFDNSTAGSGTFINDGRNYNYLSAGVIFFRDNSRAGNGTFRNNGPTVFNADPGTTNFSDTSTAENGIFTNNGSGAGGSGGITYFRDHSTAGNGIFISNGAGSTDLSSGRTDFRDDSSGGTAQIRVFGYGSLSIAYHNAPGVTIGSIEGDGGVYLGPNRLKIGSDNLSTTFSGYIGGYYGSLEKIGSGTLTLSRRNNAIGGILISDGTLQYQGGGSQFGLENVMVTAPGATLRLQNGATNDYIADTAVFSIVSGSTVDLNFGGTDTVRALVVDGVVQPAGLYGSAASGAPHPLPEFTGSGMIQAATAPTPTPMTHATNLSTRLLVGTGNDVGIGGFIVTGSGPRHLLLRGIGPSLSGIISNALPDPSLQLRGPPGFQTLTNDNWRDTQESEIIATGRAPGNDLESAIVADLAPGAYTAILAGIAGTTGVGLVEIYDQSTNQDSRLANVSTRGVIGTGDDIVIAGFILGGGTGEDAIILRGLGPSLSGFLPDNLLQDPRLELRNSQGALIASDDNWMDDPNQAAMIQAAGLAPSNNLESAIAATLLPGPYTALLSGVNNGTGAGLIEVYELGAAAHRPSNFPDHFEYENCVLPRDSAKW